MAQKVRGYQFTTLTSQVVSYSPEQGGRTQEEYSCPDANSSEIVAIYAARRNAGWTVQLQTGAVWKMSAIISGDAVTGSPEPDPIPLWTLIDQNGEQNILESGIELVQDMPTKVKNAIESEIKNPSGKSPNFVDASIADYGSPAWYALQNRAARIYHYKLSGGHSKQVTNVTLRRSIEVPASYVSTWTTTNAGKVLSNSVLIANTGMPVWVQVQLLNSGPAFETVNASGFFSGGLGMTVPFYFGWLEGAATRANNPLNRVTIAQEWQFGKWLVGPSSTSTGDGYYPLVA